MWQQDWLHKCEGKRNPFVTTKLQHSNAFNPTVKQRVLGSVQILLVLGVAQQLEVVYYQYVSDTVPSQYNGYIKFSQDDIMPQTNLVLTLADNLNSDRQA